MEVSVPLQDMLELTGSRLCETVATDWPESALKRVMLTTTCGFDGASGYVNPHQGFKYQNSENKDFNQSLFVCGFLVLQLKSLSDEKFVWNNLTPQSYRFFRPLQMSHKKEDDEFSPETYNCLSTQITNLRPFTFTMFNGNRVTIEFTTSKTLFDGKCVNAITCNRATNRCPVCLETAWNFDSKEADFTPIEDTLFNGLGLLHCEIKTFDNLLHIAYRNKAKTWDVNKNIKGTI